MTFFNRRDNLAAPTVYVTNRPAGFWQSIVFDALAALSALALGFVYHRYVDGAIGYIPVTAALAAFLVVSMLDVMLNCGKGGFRCIGVAFLWSVAAVVPFYDYWFAYEGSSTVLLVAFGVLFCFSLWGIFRSHRVQANSLKLRFLHVARLYAAKATTGAVLLFIVLYMPQLAASAAPLSQETFDAFFAKTVNVVNAMSSRFLAAPMTLATGTFEEFAKSIVKFQLRSNPDYVLLAEADRETQAAATVQTLLQKIRERLGVEASPQDRAGKVLYALLASQFEQTRARLGVSFLVLWLVVSFFVVRGIATVLYAISLLLAWFVFELLIAFGIIHIFNEARTQEVIEYSS